MEHKQIFQTRHNRLNSNPDHVGADWVNQKRNHITSELARELIPFVATMLSVIVLFICASIIYLHTTSAPALRNAAEKLEARLIREDAELLQGIPSNYSRPNMYAYSAPRREMCFLRSKLARPNMPTIHSMFTDPVSHYLVIIGVRLQNTDWRGDEFVCAFAGSDEKVACDPVVNDDRSFGYKPQYLIVVTCPIPVEIRLRTNHSVTLYRKVGGTFSNEYAYRDVTVCPSGSSNRQRRMLSVCTMLKDADEFIPDWVAFHRFVGVDHIYIYDNQVEELSKLRETVSQDIENGFVTVIPWAHEPTPCKNYLEVQIAHENDCLWRNRHSSKWMIKIDVDEYVQPMNPNKARITDYLSSPLYDRIGAVRLQNWFFGRPNITEAEGGLSLIKRNQWRSAEPTEPNAAHDKNILRPINVHYFKIHAMKLGGSAVTLDPWTELRLVHYRADNPRKRGFALPDFDVIDTSMSDTMDLIAKLQR